MALEAGSIKYASGEDAGLKAQPAKMNEMDFEDTQPLDKSYSVENTEAAAVVKSGHRFQTAIF